MGGRVLHSWMPWLLPAIIFYGHLHGAVVHCLHTGFIAQQHRVLCKHSSTTSMRFTINTLIQPNSAQPFTLQSNPIQRNPIQTDAAPSNPHQTQSKPTNSNPLHSNAMQCRGQSNLTTPHPIQPKRNYPIPPTAAQLRALPSKVASQTLIPA